MTQSNITTLQTLLNYITDSRDGYRKAAEMVERPGFKRVFETRALERATMVEQLQETIRSRGVTPEENGTVLGAAHRNLMSIAATVQDDEKAAIETIDDGEERLREKVREALEDGDLTPADRTLVMTIANELEKDVAILTRMEDRVD